MGTAGRTLGTCSIDAEMLQWGPWVTAVGTMGQWSRDSWNLQWGPLGTSEESSCSQDYWALQWGPFGTALRDNGAAVETFRAMEPAVGTIRYCSENKFRLFLFRM